jgi:pancreatic lipase-related protein 1
MMLHLVIVSIAISTAWCKPAESSFKSVCYLEGGDHWCFHNNYPFDNMPLPESPFVINPSMTLFTRENKYDGMSVLNFDNDKVTITLSSSWTFDPKKMTVFVTHGYTQGGNTGWLHNLKDAVLEWGDVNCIIVGWFHGSMRLFYPQAASNTQIVGALIADVSNEAMTMGAKGDDMWCVGHSLGAHLCGHGGRRADQKWGRITGMDPAGPWYEGRDTLSNGLAPECATFVDAWHTHGQPSVITNTGTFEPRGHVDFYPNGGGNQPGCVIDVYDDKDNNTTDNQSIWPEYDWTLVCSHQRATALFEESLKNTGCQMTSHMQCYDAWNTPGACWQCDGVCQIMGPEAKDMPGRGLFYLETDRTSLFCLD